MEQEVKAKTARFKTYMSAELRQWFEELSLEVQYLYGSSFYDEVAPVNIRNLSLRALTGSGSSGCILTARSKFFGDEFTAADGGRIYCEVSYETYRRRCGNSHCHSLISGLKPSSAF